MGDILVFNPQYVQKEKPTTEQDRLRAIAQGKMEIYSCVLCGGDIEVIDGHFPSRCPHCNAEIEEWSE